MDKKALYSLSYGVFLLSVKTKEKENACITNVGVQVANDPTRIAISVLNTNLTCELLKQSGVFVLSALDKTFPFETIKHFGMQSGRNVDKFKGLNVQRDSNDIPYLSEHVSAIISARVVKQENLGTHTLFIAEVTDAVSLTGAEPMTYAYYQAEVKPKKQTNSAKKIIGWRCVICQYVYEGETLPDDYTCPLCGHTKEDFEPIYES